MAMNIPVPFVGPAYKVRSNSINAQRCINFYLEPGGIDSKSPAALIGTPGLDVLLSMPNGLTSIRGMIEFKNKLIVVSNNMVYEVSKTWVVTEVGVISSYSGPVSMIISNDQYMLVDGVSGWVFDHLTHNFAEITDSEFPKGARKVSYLDGMAIVESPNSEQFSNSKIGDFRDWDGLDFASAEGAPDDIVSHITTHRDVWFFGKGTTEVWTNTEGGLARTGSAFMEVGCAAPFSVAKGDNSVFWLGQDETGQGVVWKAQDFRPLRISDYSVEYAIANYETIDDAISYVYQQEGHLFYVLTFPTADATWVYDISTGAWHERAFWNSQTGKFHRHRSNCHEFFSGKHVVGDFENGKLYAVDLNKYTDFGNPLVSLRTTATITENQKQVFFGSLQVDIESGVGLSTGQGDNPLMMLRFSDDSGRTWSNSRTASMGKIGETVNRCKWNRLGRGRNRVWEITISDPVKRIITGAFCTLGGGDA